MVRCRGPRNLLRGAVSAIVFLVAVGRCVRPAENARILAVETFGGKGHWDFMSAVLRPLTEAGHSVTAFTPYPDGDRENYTEVDTSDRFERLKVRRDLMTDDCNGTGPAVPGPSAWTARNRLLCDAALGDPRLREAGRRGDEGFDVLLVEPPVLDCASALANAVGAPVIYVLANPTLTFAERSYARHVSNPASVSHIFTDHAAARGTFVQRFATAALSACNVLKVHYDEWTARLADPEPFGSSPTVYPSMIFQNSHHISESAMPVPMNVIDVGGIHLRPAKGVPKEILDFIEDSPHGVIYFAFGTTVKFSSLPKHIKKAFIEVLSKVPQKVLWKCEIEVRNIPKNIMVKKRFSQREILLHPKVKLFISHGGIFEMHEAVDGGVPVLGFPLSYDQPKNLEHLVHAGMAITIDISNVSKDSLRNAISELINNEKYMKNAKKASNIFKDRPMSPARSVVYWTEYVIRHKGAPQLKSHAASLTWYQYYLLDVIGAVIIFIILNLFILYKLLKCIHSYISKNV